jgi:hypothetical protein
MFATKVPGEWTHGQSFVQWGNVQLDFIPEYIKSRTSYLETRPLPFRRKRNLRIQTRAIPHQVCQSVRCSTETLGDRTQGSAVRQLAVVLI